MIIDVSDLKSLASLSVDELKSRKHLLEQSLSNLALQQKKYITQLNTINEEIINLGKYQNVLENILETKNTEEIKQKNIQTQEENQKTAYEEIKKVAGVEKKQELILSSKTSEDDLFKIMEDNVTNEDTYCLQTWILKKLPLSSNFLEKIIKLEDDKYCFRLDLKLLALKHPNADENVIKAALKSETFDVKQLAAKISKQKNFTNLEEETTEVADKNNLFLKIAKAQEYIATLTSGYLPQASVESINSSLDFIETRIKNSNDPEYTESALKELESARLELNRLLSI